MAETSTKSAGPASSRPTLKTIAFMTGLGVTTVSRALKDAPDIGEATKKRVRLVADQVGYRPNRAGVRLRTGKTNVISLVVNTEEELAGLTSHMIQGISEILAETPYHLVVTPYTHQSDPMTPIRYVVETGSADGVILSRTEPEDPRVRYLAEKNMPFTTHGRTDMGLLHAYHDYDNTAFARDAVEMLVARGRSRIALLGPPRSLTYSKHMNDGFSEAVLRHDVCQIPFTAATVDDDTRTIASAVRELIKSNTPPDGIVCGSAGASIGACFGAEQAGFTLGKEIDLVAKQSSVDFLDWFRPGLCVINEDFRLAGRDLAKQVMALIDGTPPCELQTLVYQNPFASQDSDKED